MRKWTVLPMNMDTGIFRYFKFAWNVYIVFSVASPRWRHQMETFSALLVFCAGNSPVTGEFPAQRPVTRYFEVFFDLRLNKTLSKQSWGWWFETPSRSLWRHCNAGTGQSTNCPSVSEASLKMMDKISRYPNTTKQTCEPCAMMTSSNENILRVTGPLWGEYTGHRTSHKDQWRGALIFSLICPWRNG